MWVAHSVPGRCWVKIEATQVEIDRIPESRLVAKSAASRLIFWVILLNASARAFVATVTTAVMMPSRLLWNVRAAVLIGASRDRMAQPYQSGEARHAGEYSRHIRTKSDPTDVAADEIPGSIEKCHH